MSDWEDLGTLWRSNEPPELGDLRRRLRRQSVLIKAWFGTEIALSVIASAVGVWMIWAGEYAPVGGGIIAFSVYALLMSWRAWRGSFSVETGTPTDAIASALTRNDALKRYMRANYAIAVACTALIAGMVFTGALGEAGDAKRLQTALNAVTIGFGGLIVWLAGCGLYAERLTRERERLVALGRALGVS